MHRRITPILVVLALLCGSACEKAKPLDQAPPCVATECQAQSLPMSGGDDAPVVTDVTLECQSHAVVFLLTATDPQGTDNLLQIQQTVGVYTNDSCQGAPLELRDDLAGSGLEESFGDAVSSTTQRNLYDAICGCDVWPVTVTLIDADRNTTSGNVAARVVFP